MNAGAPAATTELLARVRALEITARRNVTSTWLGNYVTTIRGHGMEFHEARPYAEGDPERHIDWNMTARMGSPWVRTFHEEREREIAVLVDVSASMHAGWQARSKLATAVEAAATLALSAIEAGDRVTLITFRDRVVDHLPARSGPVHLHRVLRTLVDRAAEPPPRTPTTDIAAPIHALQAMKGRRMVVFLLSDLLDHDVPDDLRFLGARHDVTLVHVHDPFELAGPGPVRLLARALEGPAGWARVGARWPLTMEEQAAFLADVARRLSLSVLHLSASDEVGGALAGHLQRRRAWTR